MRQSMHLFTFVLVSVIAFSCSDSNVPVNQASLENDAGSLLKPSSSGPYVMRSQTQVAIIYSDEQRGISVSLGADPVEFCNGTINFDFVELLEISVPEDANRLIDLQKGLVRASVWPFTNPPQYFECSVVLTTTPIATGMVDLVYTDNDLLAFLNPENVNHNAFGWQAHGRLTDSNGEDVQLSTHFRAVWDGNDGASFRTNQKIILH